MRTRSKFMAGASALLIAVTAVAHWVVLEVPLLNGSSHIILAISYVASIAMTVFWAQVWVDVSAGDNASAAEISIHTATKLGYVFYAIWAVSVVVFAVHAGRTLWGW